MQAPAILILGGYGNTGLPIARLLLEETPARVILAGRHLEQAQAAADKLNAGVSGNRASAVRADASSPESLKGACAGADFLLAASSTGRYAGIAARAALDAGIDYLDIHFCRAKNAALAALAPEIERAGRCFITEAGYHPGLPAALVRHAAAQLDRVERVVVGSVINPYGGVPFTESLLEMVEEFRDYQAIFYRDGAWRTAGWFSTRDMPRIGFGRDFGVRLCYPMGLDEMRALPAMFPALQEAGFYVAGWNWFTDYFILPLMMLSLRIAPRASVRPMARLLWWGWKTFSKPPWGVIVKAEVSGTREGAPRRIESTLFHKDGYLFTAIPVAACLLQYLDGSARKPGLWMMGHLVDPARLVEDMNRMGITEC